MPASTGPGGISLNKAAAEKLNLNLDFDGAFFADGRIVLSGRPQTAGIDAALFLTSLRLACEPDDPYFSLDPDNGAAWWNEGQQLSKIIQDKLQPRLDPRKLTSKQTVAVRVFSARQEFGAEWVKLLSNYPDFKTRLVFRPQWLSQTRFGEILFKADVLLKELTSGMPTVRAEANLRAALIDKYMPSDSRKVARSLLENVERDGKPGVERPWRGNRLWFDLVAQADTSARSTQEGDADAAFPPPRTSEGAALFSALRQRDYVAVGNADVTKASYVVENAGALDLSQVYPKMFIRRFDHASRKDLPGHDPDLDLLSADVNQRTERYATAYKELRELTDIFRAYIVAAKYVKRFPKACRDVNSVPMLAAEKTEKPLPEHYSSELYITVAAFRTSRRWFSNSLQSINGGISLRGKLFAQEQTTVGQVTPVTTEVRREVETDRPEVSWKTPSGRLFVSLRIGPDDWVPPTAQQGVVPQKAVNAPPVSGTVGRFEVFEGSRISGSKLQSSALAAKYSKSSKEAIEECAKFCSADSNCIAFEIDQSNDQCQTYSTVQGAERQLKWTHGVWR